MYNWKVIITLMLSGGLVACTTTNQVPAEPDQKPQIEQPVDNKVTETESAVKENVKKTEDKEAEAKPVEEPKKEVKPPVVEKLKKTADGKLILGEEEWVFVPGLKETLKARIDTGATTSSVSAVDIVPFERDGKDWVKFKIEHDGIKTAEISLPVERWVKIKQSSADESQKRAVISTWIQIGDLKEKTEFTLADRTHLTYPLLMGRSFFRDVAVVDVGQKYVQDKITK
ncbi:ATP-dependent zinc protease [Vibrio gallaecicus]|uniref:ATP-dependent zinc protease family protein n=1 Tax=Vibrio gallaecicus TaxID=552386 RepID=UPI0010C9685F|nr:ATP-dependent zinc protease [Vibrio gallaecicus]MDN3616991.1 ATP-dependent zinc protease [Vibrio gallaecicus]